MKPICIFKNRELKILVSVQVVLTCFRQESTNFLSFPKDVIVNPHSCHREGQSPVAIPSFPRPHRCIWRNTPFFITYFIYPDKWNF